MLCTSCNEVVTDLGTHECEEVLELRERQIGDPVDRPDHYCAGRKYEPIAVIEDWGLPMHLGNALKYIARAGRKTDSKEDLRKAIWYLERYVRHVL